MKKFFYRYLYPFFICLLIRFSFFFSRKKLKNEREFIKKCLEGPMVVGLWHGDLIPVIGFFAKNIVKKRKTVVLVSPSNDGIMLGNVIKKLGGYVETGDSRKKSVYGLSKMIKAIKKENAIVVFALDGPLGPEQKAKPGAIYCSIKTKIPLVCVIAKSSKSIVINSSWDNLFIPLPFSKLALCFTNEILLSGDIEKDIKNLEAILMKEKQFCNEILKK